MRVKKDRLDEVGKSREVPITTPDGTMQLVLSPVTFAGRTKDNAFGDVIEAGHPAYEAEFRNSRFSHRLTFVVGWKDFEDDQGNKIKFDFELLQQLCGVDPLFGAAVEAALTEHFNRRFELDPKPIPAPQEKSETSGAGDSPKSDASLSGSTTTDG